MPQCTADEAAATGTVTGKVTANGVALVGAEVRIMRAPSVCNSYYFATSSTGGAYSKTGLPAGTYIAYVLPPAGSFVQTGVYNNMAYSCDSTPTLFTVSSGASTTVNINLTLPAGNIMGVVKNSRGTPLSGARVTCYSYSSSLTSYDIGKNTNSTGEYVVGPYQPGTEYTCVATYGAAFVYYKNVTSFLDATPVTVTAGANTANINFTMPDASSETKPVVVIPCP